jgi:hypothetical protein
MPHTAKTAAAKIAKWASVAHNGAVAVGDSSAMKNSAKVYRRWKAESTEAAIHQNTVNSIIGSLMLREKYRFAPPALVAEVVRDTCREIMEAKV